MVAGLALAQPPASEAAQSLPSSVAPRTVAARSEAPVQGTPEEVAAAGAQKVLGLSAEDAVKFIQAQQAFGSVVDELRSSEVVSGYRWNFEQNRGEVTLVASADQASKDRVSKLATSVGALVLDGGEISRTARAEQSVALSEYIRKAHPEIATLRVHPAQDYASLEVESPVDVTDAVNAWAAEQQPVVKVSTTVAPEMGGSLSGGVVGGAQLNLPTPNGDSECTSGFTIQRAGVRYLLTAGHCANNVNYGNNPWLLFVAERRGSYGDMQYHQIYNGGVAQPKFQYIQRSLTTNRHPAWPYIGSLVNRFGRNTFEYILVEDDDSQETIGSYTYTHMAVTDGHTNNVPGDSGGPFWYGASGGAAAAGVLSGSVWVNPIYKHAVFTPAGNLWQIWPDASYYTA